MTRVIANPTEALDQRGHARQRPQIGAETMGGCALAQGRVQLRQLPAVQPRLAPQPASRFQAAAALPVPNLVPAMRRLSTDAQGVHDGGLRLPSGKQPGRREATRFQRRHVPVPTRWLGHALASDRSA